MYNCFNMAYQDDANALQLQIKINSENLLPVPQKYNAGSLRIPADPSWPKIPQRKLIDDGDTIEPPCIVTLTGTPRRSRTVVQTPLNQSPKSIVTKDSAYSSFHHQKTDPSMYTLKRFPGYVDPRFKKVTNTKKNQIRSTKILQEKGKQSNITTVTEHLNKEEVKNLISEKKFNAEQTKMQEEKENESRQNYEENNKLNVEELHLEQNHSTNNPILKKRDNPSKNSNMNEYAGKDKSVKNICSSECILKSTVNDANTQVDITSLPVQENNGQLFFVLDKKLQSHPLSAIHVDTITVPQEYVNQCYNVQLPILTYQNIPMQVSPTGTNNVTQECLNHSDCKNQTKTSVLMKKESIHNIQLNQAQNENKSLINNTKEKSIQDRKNTSEVENSVHEENKKSCFHTNFSENSVSLKKLSNSNTQQKQESSDSEYYIPNINKKNIHNNVFKCLKTKKIICDEEISGAETTDSEFIAQTTIQRKEFTDANKFIKKSNVISTDPIYNDIKNSAQNHDQTNYLSKGNEYLQQASQCNVIITNQEQPSCQNYKTVIFETKGRNKSEQQLPSTKNESTRKLCHNSEPYITFKQKKASAKFSRKTKSYFQKNAHSALVDSDYTLVWPNCQYSKYKRYQTNFHKFGNHKIRKVNQHFNPIPVHAQNANEEIENVSNFIEHNYVQNNEYVDSRQEITKSLSKTCLQKEHCKCEISPRSNTDDIFESSKAIPPKTQELLNKNYWEYYNKLKHKIRNTSSIEQYPYHLSMDTTEKGKKGKVNEIYNKELKTQLKVNPEFQTLQQCTALSTMINKALDPSLESNTVQTKQLYMNDNMKTSSNHIVNVQNINTKKVSHLISDRPIVSKVRCNENKTNDKQVLELKSIIFFGGMMYILIIFLPMLYDYFYYEEYDDYENLSYLELIVEYILSSFKEAFGDVFNCIKQIFFYPHACKKCTNIS